MFCKYCGAQIDENSFFCSRCGKQICGKDSDRAAECENRLNTVYGNMQNKKSMSVSSMILGIMGIVAWILPIIGFPITIAGLVLGINGKKKGGKGFAIAGIILCIITLVLTIANSAIGAYQGYIGQNQFVNRITGKAPDVPSEYTREYHVVSDKELSSKDIKKIVKTLQNRAEHFTSDATVLMKDEGDAWSVEITLPHIHDYRIFDSIVSDAKLEFIAKYGSEDAEVIITNENIKSASASYQENSFGIKEAVVNIEFDEEGAELFAYGTQKYVGEPISIVFNGDVISTPTVQGAITDGTAIISAITFEEAEELADALNAGSLGVKLEEKQ